MRKIKRAYDLFINWNCNFFAKPAVQVLCLVLYKIIVDVIYVLYCGNMPDFGIRISALNIISGYMAVFIFSFFLRQFCKMGNASAILLTVIYMIYFIPITTYCSLGPGSSGLLFFMIIFALFLSVLEIVLPIYSIKVSNTHKENQRLKICFYALFIAVGILIIYISFRYTGFRIITNLSEVYQYRAEAADYNMPGWMAYLQSFSGILIPLLILIAFAWRKFLFVLFGCALLILNFSYAGHKTIIFMGVILILGYFLWRKKMIYLFMPAGCLLGVIGILEYYFSQHAYIISYFFRRNGYVFAQLSDCYYRFFSENPVDIFRSTFLGKIGFVSPYENSIPNVIGNNYFTQIINCNNGLLADVWTHLGIIGIIVIPLILIICFRLFDIATAGASSRVIVGLAAYYAVMFSNTTWSTVLLTHGYLIMCIVLFVFRNIVQESRLKV